MRGAPETVEAADDDDPHQGGGTLGFGRSREPPRNGAENHASGDELLVGVDHKVSPDKPRSASR